IPWIWRRYGWHTRFWGLLVLAIALEVIGAYLVMQAPMVEFSRPFATQPTTTVGLLVSGWSLLAWVVPTEIASYHEDQEAEERLEAGEDLSDHLADWWQQQEIA